MISRHVEKNYAQISDFLRADMILYALMSCIWEIMNSDPSGKIPLGFQLSVFLNPVIVIFTFILLLWMSLIKHTAPVKHHTTFMVFSQRKTKIYYNYFQLYVSWEHRSFSCSRSGWSKKSACKLWSMLTADSLDENWTVCLCFLLIRLTKICLILCCSRLLPVGPIIIDVAALGDLL